jgi:hypothetical protein
VCLDDTIRYLSSLGWLGGHLSDLNTDFHSVFVGVHSICFYYGLDYEFPLDGRESIGRYYDDNDDDQITSFFYIFNTDSAR